MSKWTTVPVKKETRDRLEKLPEKAGRDWDTFLRREILGEDIDGSPEVPEGFLHVMEASDEQLAEIREKLEQVPERTADELEGRFR